MLVIRPLLLVCLAALVAVPVPFAAGTAFAPSDLDRFMERVLAARDENWKKLRQYVLAERETLRVLGPGAVPVYGFRRDYTWFIKEGFFIRSPVSAHGVEIAEAERRAYEDEWIQRERRREQRASARRAEDETAESADGAQPAAGPAAVDQTGDVLAQTVEPRFVSAAYFLRFKFDPGHYALVGRERLDDRDVLKIEYYPTRLFSEGRTRPDRRVREREDEVEEKMNKVSLVTLWIDPSTYQILRYTFDNIDMDFLPGRSLVRVDEVTASMRMSEPFPGIWLPEAVEMRFALTLAIGRVSAHYDVRYHDYRRADVKVRVK